jgi:hypothetical protein
MGQCWRYVLTESNHYILNKGVAALVQNALLAYSVLSSLFLRIPAFQILASATDGRPSLLAGLSLNKQVSFYANLRHGLLFVLGLIGVSEKESL